MNCIYLKHFMKRRNKYSYRCYSDVGAWSSQSRKIVDYKNSLIKKPTHGNPPSEASYIGPSLSDDQLITSMLRDAVEKQQDMLTDILRRLASVETTKFHLYLLD